MCGRYRLTRVDRLAEKFDAELAEELHPRYNIAPTQPVPVVRPNGSRRVIASMRWGLIPKLDTVGELAFHVDRQVLEQILR